MAFLCRWRAICTPLFLLSIRTEFPIDFISILLNYFCIETLRFFHLNHKIQHKTPQIRIRARNFTKQLFVQSTGESIGTRGSCMSFDVWESSNLMHSVPFPRFGIVGADFFVISYFIDLLLFRWKIGCILYQCISVSIWFLRYQSSFTSIYNYLYIS